MPLHGHFNGKGDVAGKDREKGSTPKESKIRGAPLYRKRGASIILT